MKKEKYIELLSPAKNLECGIEAIRHGADAVYLGADKFGARASAGNSVEDIKKLCEFAHFYNAKVYVTVNTIIYEDELNETEKLIWSLYHAGVDALIIQDPGILKLNLPPIALHASTQMDNRTPEKVKFLEEAGFEQVVLARELSLKEIEDIHKAASVKLEAFVHGALCVSYSGQCYISQAMFGRSANRGECAQCCRLPYDLVDTSGKIIMHSKHLLSLKDLNQSDQLEQLIDSGISSLKIEGRLKDISYVKNVTAYYRQKLDDIFRKHPEYHQASSGHCTYTFNPVLEKSFSRGFTHYFLNGRVNDICSPNTPKSLGEEMGRVKEVRNNYLTVAGLKSFSNGDGVCYLNEKGDLSGFRINRVDTNKLYPHEMPKIQPNTLLYRNYDQDFERVISQNSANRKIDVNGFLSEVENGFELTLIDQDNYKATSTIDQPKQLARTSQEENLRKQLGKMGSSPFEMKTLSIKFSDEWFIPSSKLNELRHNAIEKLTVERNNGYKRTGINLTETKHSFTTKSLSYLGNVANNKTKEFYTEHGVELIEDAFELAPVKEAIVMRCRHCIRYMLNACPTHQNSDVKYNEPLYLVNKINRFQLKFDCKNCEMEVIKEEP